jgi:glycerol-3-phosphate acyltransferase PlsY
VELKDLLDLHEKLESRVNAYWTYWSVAVVAIGGWLFSGRQELSGTHAVAVSIGVTAFFLCNLGVLCATTKLLIGVRDEIAVRSRQQSFASPKLTVALAEGTMRFRMELTVVMHLVIDAIVIGMLLTAVR